MTQRHRDEAALDEQTASLPTTDAASSDDRLDTLARLRGLSDTDERLMLLHYFGDLSLVEVSRRSDMPLGTVKARTYRARARLLSQGVSCTM